MSTHSQVKGLEFKGGAEEMLAWLRGHGLEVQMFTAPIPHVVVLFEGRDEQRYALQIAANAPPIVVGGISINPPCGFQVSTGKVE